MGVTKQQQQQQPRKQDSSDYNINNTLDLDSVSV